MTSVLVHGRMCVRLINSEHEIMDSSTYASVVDLSEELKMSKSKIFFFQKLGLIKPEFVISKKILVFNRKKTISDINNISKLQAKGMSLNEIKTKLHEKDNLRKNSLS